MVRIGTSFGRGTPNQEEEEEEVMRSFNIATLAASDVTETTLKSAPQRALLFIEGAGDPNISALLATVGWTKADIEQAFALIADIHIQRVAAPLPKNVALESVTACEAWQAGPLVRTRAKLQLSFPEQAAFLFDDFVPGTGMDAVLNIATFLGRRLALQNDPARKATRKADHDALALIEKTGVTKDEIKRLGALVDSSHTVVALPEDDGFQAKRLDALRKVYAWLLSWTDIARTVVTRRDHLIRLGLAKRRAPKSKKPVVVPPVTPPLA
jgi:hypothetical protein